MLKFLFRLILLAVLVWILHPFLEQLPALPTEKMMDGLLDLSSDSGTSILKALQLIFWVIILAILIRYGLPIFNFFYPVARRYSTTKLLRRFQSITALPVTFTFVYFILALPAIYFIELFIFYNGHETVKEQITIETAHYLKDSLLNDQQIDLDRNAKAARDFINTYGDKYLIPSSYFWPLTKDLASNALIGNKQQDSSTKALASKLTKSYSFLTNYSGKQDIRQNERYRQYFFKQRKIEEYYDFIYELDITDIISYEGDEFFLEVDKRFQGWKEANQVRLEDVLTKSREQIFLASILLVFILSFFRSNLGKFYEKVIAFLDQGRFGVGGSARFAGLVEEWPYTFKSRRSSLFMGRSLYNPFRHIALSDDRHMITIAGTRAGKGATVIIPNLLLWKGSTLVIDPKGTNAAVTMQRRKLMGQAVHLLDPFNLIDDAEKASINPLEFLDPNAIDIREQISVIAEAIVIADEHAKDKHWDDGARTVIAGMIAHLVSSDKYENPNLTMLREMISASEDELIELLADMSLNKKAGRLPADAANRLIRGGDTAEIKSILSNADKHTEWLSSPAMKKVLSNSTFNLAEIKENPSTIYLILPPQYLQTHNRFLRLFINLVVNQMPQGGRSKVPVLLLMDEFLALGKMEVVEKAFGLLAGYNLVMWPFVQDLGKLKELYKTGVNAFIANSRAIQVFGVSDDETKEFVSKHVGDRALETNMKIEHHRNISRLRTPSEVAIDISVHSGRQYILRSGRVPMILEKVPYYRSAPISWLKNFISLKVTRGLFDNLYAKDPDFS